MKKVVLVTGASGELGMSIIKKYASNGYNVVINYNLNRKNAEEIKKYVEKNYDIEALTIKCDISDENQVDEMVKKIIKKFGRIDILINNAAIEENSDFYDKNKETFNKVFDVNVIGTFIVTKHVSKEMLKNKNGVIINVSSNNSIDKNDPVTLEYDASKAALNSLTKNFAVEFAPYIRVNAIAPGWIKTQKIIELDEYLNGSFIETSSRGCLLNSIASKEDVSNLIYFLTSDEAKFINGEIIKIDGGSHV